MGGQSDRAASMLNWPALRPSGRSRMALDEVHVPSRSPLPLSGLPACPLTLCSDVCCRRSWKMGMAQLAGGPAPMAWPGEAAKIGSSFKR